MRSLFLPQSSQLSRFHISGRIAIEEIARRYLQGETQATIAKAIKISQPSISIDLKELRSCWRDSALRDFDEAIAIGRIVQAGFNVSKLQVARSSGRKRN
jgi:hypothetical protein